MTLIFLVQERAWIFFIKIILFHDMALQILSLDNVLCLNEIILPDQ